MNIYLLSNQECSGVDNIICVSTDITQIKKSLCDNFCNGGKPQLDIWKNEKKFHLHLECGL